MHGSDLPSRRNLLKSAAAVLPTMAVSSLLSDVQAAETPVAPGPWRGLKVGVASYSLRKLPLDAAIKAIRRVGLNYVSIKDSHLAMKSTPAERKDVTKKFMDAGITPLSCGVIYMENDEANIRSAFEYAKDAGIPTIVCAPHPDSFPILDKMVKEYDIRLAIHNHGPGDKRYPSPYDAMKLAEPFDKRIGLCIDVGHTARAKVDPAEAILKCRERLYDIHLKDLNSSRPTGAPVEVGRGVLDIKAILKAAIEIQYAHHLGFEYEKDADDPLPGLAESVGYVRGVLKTI
jgi:sugar phosphate isomerase/epimerase